MEKAHFKTDVVIIGAGLTGLTLAYLLKDSKIDFRIKEARKGPGGRILTRFMPNSAPLEMGATWFGNKHRKLSQLIKSLKLEVFEQHTDREAIFQQAVGVPPQRIPIPPNPEPSYRVAGGTMSIIEKLLTYVASDRIHWGERVASIAETGSGLLVRSQDMALHTRYAVSTLPPRLLVSSVAFMDGQLYIASSETASEFPGYMEGAVRSAYEAFEALSQNFSFSSRSHSPQ